MSLLWLLFLVHSGVHGRNLTDGTEGYAFRFSLVFVLVVISW